MINSSVCTFSMHYNFFLSFFLTRRKKNATISMSTSWNGILHIPHKNTYKYQAKFALHYTNRVIIKISPQIYELVILDKKPKCSRPRLMSTWRKDMNQKIPLSASNYFYSQRMRWGFLLFFLMYCISGVYSCLKNWCIFSRNHEITS